MFTWGKNDDGVLGLGKQQSFDVPQLVEHFLKINEWIVQVSCGKSHIGALNQYGKPFLWGSDEFGQLGRGYLSTCLETIPQQVEVWETII